MRPIHFIHLVAFGSCAFLTSILKGQEMQLSDLVYSPGEMKGIESQPTLKVGDPAPDFELPTIRGDRIRLSDYRGKKKVVLSFVPAAWTPVCSAQWPGYSLAIDYFDKANAVILGITVDNIPTLHAWITAMGGIDFPVLSDFYPHGRVAENYGILRSNGMSERALFVVDTEGFIKFIHVEKIDQRPPLEHLIKALQ